MANPPITIGELIDVPAPGSPIGSAWTQEATRRINHRFATTAERDAKYPAASAGPGALCAVALTSLYMSDGTGWLVINEPPRTVTGPAVSSRWGNDAAMPLVMAGAEPSSATLTAWYVRRGWSVQFVLTVASGAAGGLSSAGFNPPYATSMLGNGTFTGSWTSNVGQIAPCLFYVGTGMQPGFYVVSAANVAALNTLPSGSLPFPSTANQTMWVQGTYFASSPPYG